MLSNPADLCCFRATPEHWHKAGKCMAIIMDNQIVYMKCEIMLKSISDSFLFVAQQLYNVDGTREMCSD